MKLLNAYRRLLSSYALRLVLWLTPRDDVEVIASLGPVIQAMRDARDD